MKVVWCAWLLLNVAVIGMIVLLWEHCPYFWPNLFGTTLIASGFLAAWGLVVELSKGI